MAAPFLKWAGGKAKLVPAIADRAPATFGRYHEPFLGAGAVFFGLASRQRLEAPALNDANAELIEVFATVRDQVDGVIAALQRLADAYLPATLEARAALYYHTRELEPAESVDRAARFIFLNRTCYNGLFRVNSAGKFNVPHGRYPRPAILNETVLREASAALRGSQLLAEDFEAACARARPGDFVYLDPPYHPLSATSRFTAYTRNAFAWQEQLRLAAVFAALTSQGVYALLSNSSHEAVRELYPGFEHVEVPMSRAINSNPSRRTPIPELLVSNVAEVLRRHA